jgi:polyisoprenoid-binding protein YceI
MMLTTITGEFKEFDVDVETEGDDFSTATICATANIASITTGSEQRDTHLKPDDFFNAEQYNQLTFKGTSLTNIGDNHWILKGDITIRDVKQQISLEVLYMGRLMIRGATQK